MHRELGLALLVAAAAGIAGAASAAVAPEKYPTKPVRMVVPAPPGFGSDVLVRIVGQKLGETYSQQIVIDNRPGAGTLIGSNIVAKAFPDGYTLLMNGQALLINTLIHKNPGYHPFNDFASVTEIGVMPSVLVIAPNVPAKSLTDLIALAKSKPGHYNFASGGVGTWSHFSGEMLKSAAGIDIVHVPFRVLPDAFIEMTAGRVHLFVVPLTPVMPMLKSGKLRPLMVTTSRRMAALPDVPTTAEAGVPDYQANSWYGIFAPAKTPRAIIARLNRDIVRIMQDPEIKQSFLVQGAEPAFGTPEQFLKLQKDDYVRLQKLVKDVGIESQ